MFVSIIIPVKKINDYIKESIPKILKLNYSQFEIIIFTDCEEPEFSFDKTKIVASGKVGPAQKRDLAIKYAKGDILAFLDDDAYPENDWLEKALVHFKNEKVAAVGGPAITPESDDLWQKLSATVFESFIGGAFARNRYLSLGCPQEVTDWPTVNLLIRKKIFIEIGGFDSKYWPGEDTKLCLDLINKGLKIIYEPQAIVYHHRRSNLLNHFKQIGNYGIHRGHFAKIYPKTSFKLNYFIPSFFVLYIFSLFFIHNILFLLPIYLYLFLIFLDGVLASIRWKKISFIILTPVMIFLTHFYYGIRFFLGFIVKDLKM